MVQPHSSYGEILSKLKVCALKRDLQWAKEIHAEAAVTGCDANAYVVTALIRTYARCGCMESAHRAFDGIAKPGLVPWNALLYGYAANGQGREALHLFPRTKAASGCGPDSFTYVAALKACMPLSSKASKEQALKRGRDIHSEMGCHRLDLHVCNTLVDLYAKCGSMADAQSVFDTIHNPNVVSWTALIYGYADQGKGEVALSLLSRMKNTPGCSPNAVTYAAALKACASLAANGDKGSALRRGRDIHSELGCNLSLNLKSTLVDMYSKCGSMQDAQKVFDSIQNPDVVSWNALILGYANNDQACTALELFDRMKNTFGCTPDAVTYFAALKACTSLAAKGENEAALKRGREIHLLMGCNLDAYTGNALVDMYAKCGSMVEARRVFDNLQVPDAVSWNALLLGYAVNGEGETTLDLFYKMKGCTPDSFTYVAVFKACTSLAVRGERQKALRLGKDAHLRFGSQLDVHTQATLIDMYAKCGSMEDARRVFEDRLQQQQPDVVSWNALLHGYAENGEAGTALGLFARMSNTPRCVPNSVTYIAVIKACSLLGALALGRRLHAEMKNAEVTPHLVTCLVDFYAKCGSMGEACEAYELHPRAREASTWNALLAGYAGFGDSGFVFSLFEAQTGIVGLQPDAVTFVCLLVCCSHAGLVEKARELFEEMPLRYGVKPDVRHYTCLVDVLGRSKQVEEAAETIQGMPCEPDFVTWMTLLSACRKWKNAEIGRWAFGRLVEIDNKHAPAYILMADIYRSCNIKEQQEAELHALAMKRMSNNNPSSRC